MRRVLFGLVGLALVTAVAACAPAPPTGPTPAELTAAADALDRQFLDAFNKGDADALSAPYWNSPDLVSFGPEGMGTKGWDAARAGGVEMLKAMPGVKLEFIATHNDVHGDVVLGWGTWKMTIPTPVGAQVIEGRYTDAKAMKDGKMVYVMDHASVPPPPPVVDPVKK